MDDIEIEEIELDDIEETDEGSLLATAAVIGVGALLGFAACRGYGKAKEVVVRKLNDRRARKILNTMEYIETTAEEAE